MTDVETNAEQHRPQRPIGGVANPYQPHPGAIPPDHIIHKIKRVVYIILSGYGLHYFKFYKTLLVSPKIRHTWFQVGIACTIAILIVKAYIETYDGKICRKQISYETYPHTTHVIIALILASTLAFNIALWPHYGWNSPILLGLCFFGVILQFLLIVPTSVQNVVGIMALTFFLQEYSGLGLFQPMY